jgi:hypothetical protein
MLYAQRHPVGLDGDLSEGRPVDRQDPDGSFFNGTVVDVADGLAKVLADGWSST